ncbi:hypothetical protein [Amycolatopsis sp. NPDC051128]|jgi:hypothetical protein|uniref:hypothetical protein n=1 Tax=Amycolatopsis sp. NPDC051128 TaxID=3155412 RepID=UPI0034237D5F
MRISPELVEMLGAASVEQRRQIVERICKLAVERTGLSDQVVIDATNGLRHIGKVDPSIRDEVGALTQQLDERAWDIQEAVEIGSATEDEYLTAFAKARAVAAVGFALEDSLSATLNAVYEAYYAIGDREEFMRTLGSAPPGR